MPPWAGVPVEAGFEEVVVDIVLIERCYVRDAVSGECRDVVR